MSEEESIASEGYERQASSAKPNQQSNEQEAKAKEPLPKSQPQSEPQPPAVAEGLPQAQQPQPLPIAIGTQPEIMETHAHHLHKSPGHGWKHYLFEFLMLFLAVFAGFLAENKREHIVEKTGLTSFCKACCWMCRTI